MNLKEKKVLYISNIEVPYRTEFFNQLAKQCNLTVLYEKDDSSERNKEWTKSINKNYRTKYLNGKRIKGDNFFSFKILSYIFSKPDLIIIGCYNSPVQMFAMLVMRIFNIKYLINLDGNPHLEVNALKTNIKKYFLKGGVHYLVAGNVAYESIKSIISEDQITIYPFSSLTKKEIQECTVINKTTTEEEFILVVGQYYDYKGLDIAAKVAKNMTDVKWKFVGTGNRSLEFIKDENLLQFQNIEVIDFLPKEKLYQEYAKCKVLVLPSKQECWGLVVNEAAAIGTPIVSTMGSGAAVEFLKNSKFDCFLAKANNVQDLENKVRLCLQRENSQFSKYLIEKSKEYTIEKCVQKHIDAFKAIK